MPSQFDLLHHGDAEMAPGLVDLAVNVTDEPMPAWLRDALLASLTSLRDYPDASVATAAVARRHGRSRSEVLLTSGAAEAFVLLARALQPSRAVIVHPQFTEPEQALRAAGHRVDRVVLHEPFTLRGSDVPDDADFVVVGNPTNPTSVLHPASVLRELARPGRTLVVDEAFMDAVPGERESLAAARDVAGLVVVRSLTKTWALAGLRIGYVLAATDLVVRLRAAQPLWSVSTPALAAAEVCSSPAAVGQAGDRARDLVRRRAHLQTALSSVPGLHVVPDAAAPFVLLHAAGRDDLRVGLRRAGFALRRGDTFPGLGNSWLRMAVRPAAVADAAVTAMRQVLAASRH